MPGLKKLDYYIIKKYLGTFFLAILLIISISVVFDISEKIDDFIASQVSIEEIIFDYYLNFIPYFTYLFSYLFSFVAVIFFTSKMASNTEIIAILSCGVSFRRLMLPYFVSAAIIASLSFLLGSYLIPRTNKVRLDFESKYIKDFPKNKLSDVHMKINPGVYIYFKNFKPEKNTATNFTIEHIENGKLKSKLTSSYADYDTLNNQWILHHYTRRSFNGMQEEISFGEQLDTVINLHPEEFAIRKDKIVETLTSPQLRRYIAAEKIRGEEQIESLLIEKNRRISDPFSVFILTIIGVSLSCRKVKGGIGMHIGLAIALSFIYIFFMQISSVLSINGSLNPTLATWTPNIIFAGIAFYLYLKAPK